VVKLGAVEREVALDGVASNIASNDKDVSVA